MFLLLYFWLLSFGVWLFFPKNMVPFLFGNTLNGTIFAERERERERERESSHYHFFRARAYYTIFFLNFIIVPVLFLYNAGIFLCPVLAIMYNSV